VFEFIDQILSQRRNNPRCEFDKFEDISTWLRDQWAGLFAEYLRQRQDQRTLLNISAKIDELSQVSESLKTYTESLMKKVQPEGFNDIIQSESKKIEEVNKKNIFFSSKFFQYINIQIKIYNYVFDEGDIYNTFMQTNDLPEFLKAIGFGPNTAKLLETDFAKSDYRNLRSRMQKDSKI